MQSSATGVQSYLWPRSGKGFRAGTQARTGNTPFPPFVVRVPSVRSRNRRRKQGKALQTPPLGHKAFWCFHHAGIRRYQHWAAPAVSVIYRKVNEGPELGSSQAGKACFAQRFPALSLTRDRGQSYGNRAENPHLSRRGKERQRFFLPSAATCFLAACGARSGEPVHGSSASRALCLSPLLLTVRMCSARECSASLLSPGVSLSLSQ